MPAYLPHSEKVTTALGLGCAYLVGGLEERKSQRIVDVAYEAGLRHFDVAPSYGMGTAEDVLGRALARRRDAVTIATKVGIARAAISRHIMFARALARPLRAFMPLLTRRLGQSVTKGTVVRGQFSPAFVEKSLHDSLRRLKTDYLDLWLLHEVRLSDLSDELLTMLDKGRKAGFYRGLGVASDFEWAAEIAMVYNTFFDVFQYSWSALDLERPAICASKINITHRALMRAYEPMRGFLARNEAACTRLSLTVGVDLSLPSNLADVLVGAALHRNEGGIVLVASHKQSRVTHFGTLLKDDIWKDRGKKLMEGLTKETLRPHPP